MGAWTEQRYREVDFGDAYWEYRRSAYVHSSAEMLLEMGSL